ncbi:MAG: hypothetical protein MUO76_11695 [Anaerolineaceae bacterium]|nr:hypothetical protein [Anaerolineaceae bacterium]
MDHFLRFLVMFIFLVLAACSGGTASQIEQQGGTAPAASPDETASLTEQQVVDLVWVALEPNTWSHDHANWEVIEVRQAAGRDVAEQFEGAPAVGCWQGPTPEANGMITSTETYWHVHMMPRPATPFPREGETSPTAPPAIPEPVLRQAFFLVDDDSGEIVARKLICVVY